MSIFNDLKAALKKREEQSTANGGKVLIFGPGDSEGKRKRSNLAKRLRRRGFSAYTSESLSKKVPSSLTAYQQEDEHWRLVDIVIAFNFSIGVNGELAAYAYHEEFLDKTLVFYPEQYDPYYSGSYASDVLREYPHKTRVTVDEWSNCNTSQMALDQAVAVRSIESRRSARHLGHGGRT